MSVVTDILLTASVLEEIGNDDVCPAVDELNKWLCAFCRKDKGLVRVDQYSGGDKATQGYVFIGSFNGLDLPEFMEVFKSAPWIDKRGTSLFIQLERADRFVDMTPKEFRNVEA